VIGGDLTSAVTEDVGVVAGLLTTTGTLTISDPDAVTTGDQNQLNRFVAETVTGTYGALTIDADGNWTYSVDNGLAAVQALGVGQSMVDSLTISQVSYTSYTAELGVANETIDIVIHGTNDAPTPGRDDYVLVEGDIVVADLLANDTDPDGDALTIIALDPGTVGTPVAFAGGVLTVASDGALTFDSSGMETGTTGATVSFGYTVSDGAGGNDSGTVSFGIAPSPDAATFGGKDNGVVEEDLDVTPEGLIVTSGVLAVTDPDALILTEQDALNRFVPDTFIGTYGTLVIDAFGAWTYSADNNDPRIQAFDKDLSGLPSDIETFNVHQADYLGFGGDTHVIGIYILGQDEIV
jgi:VCBS repeat-containing protein